MRTILNYLKSAVLGVGLLASIATAKAEILSGKVYDVLTSQTMDSFPVQLDNEKKLTDLNGNYNFDIPSGIHHLKISDNITNYFNYEEDVNLTTTLQRNVYMIPVREVDTQYYPDLLDKLKYITSTDGTQSHSGGNTKIFRWRDEFIPIPVWYNELQAIQIHGQDTAQVYYDICDTAIKEWEEKSGINLFQRVYQNPDVGIELNYIKGPSFGYLSWFQDNTPKKLELNTGRGLENVLDQARRVLEHEFGHCLGFTHSRDPKDIMGLITSEGITQNEADIVHIIYTLPNFTDMKYYNNIKTRNSVKDWNFYR